MTSFNKLFGIIYFGSHFLLKRIQLLIVSLFFLGSTYIFGLGTQFLSIPGTALELAIGINPVLDGGSFSNPAAPILNKSNPDLFFSHGSWLADVTGSTIRFSRGFTYGTGGLQIRYAGLNDLEFRTSTPADNSLENFGAYGVSFGGFYNRVLGNTRYVPCHCYLKNLLVFLYVFWVVSAIVSFRRIGIIRFFFLQKTLLWFQE